MRSPHLAAFALSLLIPAVCFAQDDEGDGLDTDTTMEEGATSDEGAATDGDEDEDGAAAARPAAKVETDGAPYAVRRGVFVSGDFGIYFRFGGTNTNSPGARPLPSRSTSNIQPYYGIVAGYDLVDTPDFSLSGGLRFGMLLNGGSGSASANDSDADPNTFPNDYSVIQTGVAFKGSLRVADRVGLVFGLDGGLALLDPDPLAPAANGPGINGALESSGGIGIGGIAGLSVGAELYTLLDGFTIGSNLRFTAIFAGSDFIPGLAIEVVNFKYNF